MNDEKDIRTLLGYSGAEFISAAYRQYLRREPDRSGLETFLTELMIGKRKEEILVEICVSEEGRSRGCSLETLSKQLQSIGKKLPDIRGHLPFSERIRRSLKRRILFDLFREHTEMFMNRQIAVMEPKRYNEVFSIPVSGIVNPVSTAAAADDRGTELPDEVFRIFSGLKDGNYSELRSENHSGSKEEYLQ